MITESSRQARISGAILGMFIGDALAMPVHWYYDTKALVRDYGLVSNYMDPKNPHPDSILWRSSYTPLNESGNILHDQARYWGRKGIHYHQFLQKGENTLNLKLARELFILLEADKGYSPDRWLERLVSYMLDPSSHGDTYVEEYLRYFFTQYAKGSDPTSCGRPDENHIGGLSLMLPVLIALSDDPDHALAEALRHLALTHGGSKMAIWGKIIALIILELLEEQPLHQVLATVFAQSSLPHHPDDFIKLFDFPDDTVVRQHFSSACYVDYSVPATLYLALKYQQDPEQALIVNTMCGGDNCGRGAVLGALLGSRHGNVWPWRWVEGLREPPPVVQPKLQAKQHALNHRP